MTPRRIFIHHSFSAGGDINFLRHVHTREKGWPEVGYHYVIPNGQPLRNKRGNITWPSGPDGDVQTGRPTDRAGAHAYGCNNDSLGICVIGMCHQTPPTIRQIASLMGLCRRLCREHDIPPENILGHRDCPTSSTECPGMYLYELLPFIRMVAGW